MADETAEYGNLIGSDKVEGTAVYGANGESIGSIERVMIDKKTGKVSFAVFGLRWIPGNWERSLPTVLESAHIRHRLRRLPNERYRGAVARCSKVRARGRLGLE